MANKPIIESRGITIDKFFIPPFTLMEREILIIEIINDIHFFELTRKLIDIFTGKIKNDFVDVFQPVVYSDYFKESEFRRIFFPVSVGEYLKKSAHTEADIAKLNHHYPYINSKIKMNTLAGSPRRLANLISTLSHSKNIIFDLAGVDRVGAEKIYRVVKDAIKNGGSAILLDHFKDFENDCTKFVKVEIVSDL